MNEIIKLLEGVDKVLSDVISKSPQLITIETITPREHMRNARNLLQKAITELLLSN